MSSKHTSKFLSLVLRHQPALIGLMLDDAGWTDVDALLAGCATKGVRLTRAELGALVAGPDKQRFALSADGQRIRANQGHSIDVELGLPDAAARAPLPRHLPGRGRQHPGRGPAQGRAPRGPPRGRHHDREQGRHAARRSCAPGRARRRDGGRRSPLPGLGQRGLADRARAAGVSRLPELDREPIRIVASDPFALSAARATRARSRRARRRGPAASTAPKPLRANGERPRNGLPVPSTSQLRAMARTSSSRPAAVRSAPAPGPWMTSGWVR